MSTFIDAVTQATARLPEPIDTEHLRRTQTAAHDAVRKAHHARQRAAAPTDDLDRILALLDRYSRVVDHLEDKNYKAAADTMDGFLDC